MFTALVKLLATVTFFSTVLLAEELEVIFFVAFMVMFAVTFFWIVALTFSAAFLVTFD